MKGSAAEVNRKWSYATSSLFLVLLSDLDSWNDLDPSTYQFRLYFLCDTESEGGTFDGPPQPVYISLTTQAVTFTDHRISFKYTVTMYYGC